MYFIHSLLHTVVEVIFMVPKNGTETQKRAPLLSTTEWHVVQSQLARAMGYDTDEEDEVMMTYWFSNALKSSHDVLEDNDDYQGIVSILQALPFLSMYGHRDDSEMVIPCSSSFCCNSSIYIEVQLLIKDVKKILYTFSSIMYTCENRYNTPGHQPCEACNVVLLNAHQGPIPSPYEICGRH
jgi:hypothetical protein